MCGRYVLSNPGDVLDQTLESLDGFGLRAQTPPLLPRWNVAPTQPMPILYAPETASHNPSTERVIELAIARWSFSGPHSRKSASSSALINARCETLLEKPTFSRSFHQRRCLVPASGFYEWRPRGNRQPFYFHRPGRSGFCFAGLWRATSTVTPPAPSPQSATPLEFCIITGTAGEPMSEIHHRRPIILSRATVSRWLHPQTSDTELLEILRDSDPVLERHPVSFRVNSVRNDDMTLLDEVGEAPTNLTLF